METGKPLGDSVLQTPFAVTEDIRTGRQHAAHRIVSKYESMVRAFRAFDHHQVRLHRCRRGEARVMHARGDLWSHGDTGYGVG